MFNDNFSSINDLKDCVKKDKQANGPDAATKNRYPIRFVLFDNFRDCYEFVDFLQSDCDVQVESVDHWIDPSYPDIIITQYELAEKIKEHIKKICPSDCVIAPFSELARFYDNQKRKDFDALLKTVKGIEASTKAIESHQRIYIPVVGLEGKMEVFQNDSQITIWRLASEEKDLTYRLILTDNIYYGVKGLESKYTIVNNIRDWLNIWKDSKTQVTPNIICKSHSIFANAEYAQPDNAFSYATCTNAFEFLTIGLQLSFGGLQPLISDGDNWEKLASMIDLSNGFKFEKFVLKYFGVSEIKDYKDFIKLWCSHHSVFDRWLLARFYMNSNNEQEYLCKILKSTSYYGNNEFIESMVSTINKEPEDMAIRKYSLQYADRQSVVLSDAIESLIYRKLNELSLEIGYTGTLKYFTGLPRKEKELALVWYGQNHINSEDIKQFYPDLYNYVKDGVGLSNIPDWVEEYFKKYKIAKISNTYTSEIAESINELNASESSFDNWYNQFSSTYTLLKNRGDIEVFYWVDGLGADWIPLIKQIISEKNEQGIFLNEIMVARALLPTKTSNNKSDLQRLMPNGAQLEKAGDLDGLAHTSNNICPFTLIKELDLVRNIINEILNKYAGKKIAIISDHGLSYLPQLRPGKNMGGVDSDHNGRIAIRKTADNTSDDSYFRLEDKKTLCALKHESLCSKVPANQGSHGGCTPEETLVPIFIISGSKNVTTWSASIMETDISGVDPHLRFTIKNLKSFDKPYLMFNGNRYEMKKIGTDTFETEPLLLEGNTDEVSLWVGNDSETYHIKINTGAQTEDLFDF